MNQTYDIEDVTQRAYSITERLCSIMLSNNVLNKVFGSHGEEMRKECFHLVAQYFHDHEHQPTLSLDLMHKVLEDAITRDIEFANNEQLFDRYIQAMKQIAAGPNFEKGACEIFSYENKQIDIDEVSKMFLSSCSAYFYSQEMPDICLAYNKLSREADQVNKKAMHQLVKECTDHFGTNLSLLAPLRSVQTVLNKATALAGAMNQSMTGTYQSAYAHLLDKSAQMITQLQIDDTPTEHLDIEPVVLSERINREREAKQNDTDKPYNSWGYNA